MSSWDTPSAVSVGDKPKSQSPHNRNCQLMKASHRNLKELIQTKQQKHCLHKTDIRVYTRYSQTVLSYAVKPGVGIQRAALWSYPQTVLQARSSQQQCSKPNHKASPLGRHCGHTHTGFPYAQLHNTEHKTSPLPKPPSHTGISHQLTSPWGKFKSNIIELFFWIPVERREFYIEETISLHW